MKFRGSLTMIAMRFGNVRREKREEGLKQKAVGFHKDRYKSAELAYFAWIRENTKCEIFTKKRLLIYTVEGEENELIQRKDLTMTNDSLVNMKTKTRHASSMDG